MGVKDWCILFSYRMTMCENEYSAESIVDISTVTFYARDVLCWCDAGWSLTVWYMYIQWSVLNNYYFPLFYILRENLVLIWRRHFCWWKTGSLCIWSALLASEQEEMLIVAHLLTVTDGLGFCGRIQRTAPSSLCNRYWGPFLTHIPARHLLVKLLQEEKDRRVEGKHCRYWYFLWTQAACWDQNSSVEFLVRVNFSRRPRGAVVRTSGAKIWWSLRRGFESNCGTWVPVFRMRPYKPRSRVAVGVAR
jgi:hypothetical protein